MTFLYLQPKRVYGTLKEDVVLGICRLHDIKKVTHHLRCGPVPIPTSCQLECHLMSSRFVATRSLGGGAKKITGTTELSQLTELPAQIIKSKDNAIKLRSKP